MRRRAVVSGVAGLVGGCVRSEPSRRFLLVELTREARVEGEGGALAVSACQWHVSREGALYGDHWGWCEDYKILPEGAPGYLLLTTLFSGGASGGFGRLV